MFIAFALSDILTRVVVGPIVHIRPGSRTRVLSAWSGVVSRTLVGLVEHVGRARFDVRAKIPARGGVLMVMNHQSVIDVPLAFTLVPSGYPRMVAHARYGKGVPLVSYMLSLYGHITVQPGRTGRAELDRLEETARESTLPIVIFPEGHRSRDGEIRPWKRAGLEAFLSAREWTVYVVVLDGLWKVARIPDFIRHLAEVRCRVECAGPFTYDGRGRESHDEFVDHLHRVMCAKLSEMRGHSAAGTTPPAIAKESAASAVKTR